MKKQLSLLLCAITLATAWPLAAKTLREEEVFMDVAQPVIMAKPATQKQPTISAKSAFMALIPSLKCTLGWRSCSQQEIDMARFKVKAYIAAFGMAALLYGMKVYMDYRKPVEISRPSNVQININPRVVHKLAAMKEEILTKADTAGGSGLYIVVNRNKALQDTLSSLKSGYYPIEGDLIQEEKAWIRQELIQFVRHLLSPSAAG